MSVTKEKRMLGLILILVTFSWSWPQGEQRLCKGRRALMLDVMGFSLWVLQCRVLVFSAVGRPRARAWRRAWVSAVHQE